MVLVEPLLHLHFQELLGEIALWERITGWLVLRLVPLVPRRRPVARRMLHHRVVHLGCPLRCLAEQCVRLLSWSHLAAEVLALLCRGHRYVADHYLLFVDGYQALIRSVLHGLHGKRRLVKLSSWHRRVLHSTLAAPSDQRGRVYTHMLVANALRCTIYHRLVPHPTLA